MLQKEVFTAQLMELFQTMQTKATTENPMSDAVLAQELATIIDAYVRSATVLIDTFTATTPMGGPVSGTATGGLL
ncbi:hypothetical protein PVA44_07615 (plasmid) [Entomospira nematocerorum]|uniref:Uncharacterized protein n=1 Tax=Entomospira nematocerorum TaxID=2719987 RepID=A0A968KUY6_9SPIO|nr:hypothetical protein [Entomospira nematocera]NIZ47779.1 hypothetical protein [Entomospira nematocera]WDI34733.1 hypothetical protein PVA44_07615 [Entomospira nematocera]